MRVTNTRIFHFYFIIFYPFEAGNKLVALTFSSENELFKLEKGISKRNLFYF